MHDPLSSADLAADELRQRRESGYDIAQLAADLARTSPDEDAALEVIYQALLRTQKREDWPYAEPDALDDILAAMPVATSPFDQTTADPDRLDDRILGGWLGRIAGCNLGKPIENGDFWTPERIRSYLKLADAYPLRDYIPALDPMPAGYHLQDSWLETTRGRIAGSARDDDIDYAIIAVWLLEQYGHNFDRSDVAAAMLAFLPYLRVFTAERAAMVNLLHRVPVERVAEVRNPYREWIGALIRVDVYGWTCPGRPEDAIRLAYADATLTHRRNGVYGALWAAALVSAACTATSVREAVEVSLGYLPSGSRLAEAVHGVYDDFCRGASWEEAVDAIRHRYGHYSWVHTVNNACLISAGLLWGADDYAATVGLTVQGGWDTDSSGATAGSVVGTVLGAAALPAHFVVPLQDRTRSAVFGYDHSRISDLAARTVRLAEQGLPGRRSRVRS
ncbi:MAG TPA: ADP-ribosylglycohydrolase family protein [Propionibacteriaceae bacterium]|nr:ADP-ribosylglycohydrolase family protein [Propionibacteriaceae bacterium]